MATKTTKPKTKALTTKKRRHVLSRMDREIIVLRLQAGEKPDVLASAYDVSMGTIYTLQSAGKARCVVLPSPTPEQAKVTKETLADSILALAASAWAHISPVKLMEASAKELAVMGAVLFDKYQLLTGGPTNTSRDTLVILTEAMWRREQAQVSPITGKREACDVVEADVTVRDALPAPTTGTPAFPLKGTPSPADTPADTPAESDDGLGLI